MAEQAQLAILRQGVQAWNAWRAERAALDIDLSGADLHGANLHVAKLSKADLRHANLNRSHLSRANLIGADLSGAGLWRADLREAHLREAHLEEADVSGAWLSGADLSGASLRAANLSEADLSGADLTRADLRNASLVETNLAGATISDCAVYGASAWDVRLKGATQSNLSINPPGEPLITVDNLKVAQFLYLILHNNEIRDVIDTLTSKVVLILGRFTPERKEVLDALREELRKRNYVPVLFDSEGPSSRDIVETVVLLARMARFIVADLTDAAMVRTELSLIVPELPSVPVQPLLQGTARELPEIQHLKRFDWLLPIHSYDDLPTLLTDLPERVIATAEAKVAELRTAG
jgi:Pentapeptide repeats (8 copies)